uniref:Uncharacterized protein n=1 Tax=Manihot esculenta TaxID=3983 RepID=A0A2C9U2L5_MANES
MAEYLIQPYGIKNKTRILNKGPSCDITTQTTIEMLFNFSLSQGQPQLETNFARPTDPFFKVSSQPTERMK